MQTVCLKCEAGVQQGGPGSGSQLRTTCSEAGSDIAEFAGVTELGCLGRKTFSNQRDRFPRQQRVCWSQTVFICL